MAVKDPGAQAAQAPAVLDWPGMQGQVRGVAQVRVVVVLKSARAVGRVGQEYASLRHTASLFTPVHWPAR